MSAAGALPGATIHDEVTRKVVVAASGIEVSFMAYMRATGLAPEGVGDWRFVTTDPWDEVTSASAVLVYRETEFSAAMAQVRRYAMARRFDRVWLIP